MSRLTVASENAALAAVLVPTTTYYLSAHSADPGQTGASELTGGGYARQAIVFAAPSGGTQASNTAQTVPNAGTTAVTYTGIWTASTGGTFICGQQMTSPVTAASISFPSGSVTEVAS